eukprot:snap_masked-scaffold_14-processed-gene-5.26-mRNA-1 protein AED:1.00 eAED:1.00 QI:0/-1/0/0/-1/1/1/0/80
MAALTKCKEDIAENCISTIKKIEIQFKGSVRYIFADNGTEFPKLFEHAQTEGIKVENSLLYIPIENGKVERYNRTALFCS